MKTLFLVFVIALAFATALSVTRKSWQPGTAFMRLTQIEASASN